MWLMSMGLPYMHIVGVHKHERHMSKAMWLHGVHGVKFIRDSNSYPWVQWSMMIGVQAKQNT